MAFVFRFARVKSIRELEEDLAQQKLALSRLEEQQEIEKLRLFQEEESRALHGFCRPHATDMLTLELEARYCHERAQASDEQEEVRHKAAARVDYDREQLILRMQKAKIMQNLHDRHHEIYQQEELLAEQKILDEVGGMQHLRRSRAGR